MKLLKYLDATANEVDNKNIFWICWMFFMWGIASSMIFTLLPLFVVDELGGGYKSFGLIEGGVIFISFISKLFAGVLIDIFKRKKPMLMCGTILTMLSKISIACACSIVFVFIAKALDRFAKGLRSAPSDAILADLSCKYGFAYSMKYRMNVAGSLTGSVITSGIVFVVGNNYRLIFFLAVIPTIFAYIILKKKLTYESNIDMKTNVNKRWKFEDVKKLSFEYWNFVIIIAILMFARFSEGFITLRAKEIMPDGIASFPIFMAIYEICAVCVSIPVGRLSDKFDKKLILLYGILLLMVTDIIALFACNSLFVIIIYIGAGMHMGATHGILSSVIAQSSPKEMVGTAFAIYYAIDGICIFCSNYIAGLSSNVALLIGMNGSAGPFIQGILACFVASCYILFLIYKKNKICSAK